MKKKIMIEGMSCGHCSGRVEKILKEQDGVTSVIVDLGSKSAIVESSKDLSDEAIKEVIEDIGFEATSIENL